MVVQVLGLQNLGPLGPTNFVKHAISFAVNSGVSPETVILLILFPLVASLIAAVRYLIGIRGFGIFTPAMLAVTLLITGVLPGISLFVIILAVATLVRLALRRLKIHYLAKMALLLWFICLAVFVSLLWIKTSIFPILILILLIENFIELQTTKGPREAMRVTIETFILSLASLGVLRWQWLHRMTLTYPEIVVLGTVVFNLFLGRFTGLRLLEHRRFKRLVG